MFSSSQQCLKKLTNGDISSANETPKILDEVPKIQSNLSNNDNCVVINDHDDLNDTAAEITHSTQAVTITCDKSANENCDNDDDDNDEDCNGSDGEQDLAISDKDKSQILSLLNMADLTELALVRQCSLTKAKKICSLRPFTSWKELV